MKKIIRQTIYSIVCLVFCVNIHAQKTEKSVVNWGKELKCNAQIGLYDKLLKINNKHVVLYTKKPTIMWPQTSTIAIDLEKEIATGNGKLIIPNAAKKEYPLQAISTKSKSFLLTVVVNKKENVILKLREIDESGSVLAKEIEIGKFGVDTYIYTSFTKSVIGSSLFDRTKYAYIDRDDALRVLISEDNTKIGLLVRLEEGAGKYRTYIKVIDENANMLWENTINHFLSGNSKLLNSGTLGVVALKRTETKQPVHVYKQYSSSSTQNEVVIDLGNRLTGYSYIFEGEKNIIISGIYSLNEDDSHDVINGLYYVEIDTSLNKVNNSFTTPIDDESFRINASKKVAKMGGVPYSPSLSISKIYKKTDGSLLFLIESKYSDIVIRNNPSKPGHTIDGGYVEGHRGCGILNISNQGKLNWITILPLHQHSAIPTIGVVPRFRNDNLYLIYNENSDNINKKLDKPAPYYNMGDVIVETKIDTEGKVFRKIISSDPKNGQSICPESPIRLSENEIAFIAMGMRMGYNPLKIVNIKLVDW